MVGIVVTAGVLAVLVWLLNYLLCRPEVANSRAAGLRPVFLVGWLYITVPALLQVALNGRYLGQFSLAEQGAYTGPATAVGRALQFAFMGILLFTAIRQRRTPRPEGAGGALVVLALLPWVWMVGRGYAEGHPLVPLLIVYPLTVIVVWRASPSIADFAILGRFTVVTAGLSVALGLATDFGAFRAGPLADKALIGSSALAGPFPHSNTLGVILAMGLPAVALIERKGIRRLGYPVILLAIGWSWSRTSMVTAALVLLALMAFRLMRGRRGAIRVVGVCLALALLAVMAWLPLTTTDLNAQSQRGRVWIAALGRWRSDPLFGSGPETFYLTLDPYSSLLDGAFHAHNMVVMLLVTGGWSMLLLVGLLVVAAARRTIALAQRGQPVAFASLVSLLGVSILEAPTWFWTPSPQGVTAWFALTLTLFARSTSVDLAIDHATGKKAVADGTMTSSPVQAKSSTTRAAAPPG